MKKYSRIAFVTAVITFLGGDLQVKAQSGCFLIEPYVAQVNHESAMVLWLTPPGSAPGVFILKSEDNEVQQTLSADIVVPPFRDRIIGDLELVRQSVQLEELLPYHRYQYNVECEDGSASYSGSFRTGRTPGESEPFEFVVMSDVHANYGHHGPVAEAVGKAAPDFILHTGDLDRAVGEYWSNWLELFEVGRPYFNNTPFLTVVGNHDIEPAGNFRFLFGYNDPELTRDQEDDKQTYYSYYYGNLHVIALDFHTQRGNLEPQLAWLETELENSTADWVIVTFHDSMLSVGGRDFYRRDILRDYALLLLEHEVDLVFFGHDHFYERLIPIGSEGKNPVNFVSTNSGGHVRATRPSPIVVSGIAYRGLCMLMFRLMATGCTWKPEILMTMLSIAWN
jgi:predicted phosphodiesterase